MVLQVELNVITTALLNFIYVKTGIWLTQPKEQQKHRFIFGKNMSHTSELASPLKCR